MQYTF